MFYNIHLQSKSVFYMLKKKKRAIIAITIAVLTFLISTFVPSTNKIISPILDVIQVVGNILIDDTDTTNSSDSIFLNYLFILK